MGGQLKTIDEQVLDEDLLSTKNKVLWLDRIKRKLKRNGVFYVVDSPTPAKLTAGATRNIRRKDRPQAHEMKEHMADLLAGRTEEDENTACEILLSQLTKTDQMELLGQKAKEIWTHAQDMGKDTEHDMADVLETAMLKIRYNDYHDMKKYLETKRAAWRDLENAKPKHVDENVFFLKALVHLGRHVKAGEKFREIFIELRNTVRQDKMTWEVMKTKLMLAAVDEEESSDSGASDNSDDDVALMSRGRKKSRRHQARDKPRSSQEEEIKRLQQELAFYTSGAQGSSQCTYCRRKGHGEDNCWTKMRNEGRPLPPQARRGGGRGGRGGRRDNGGYRGSQNQNQRGNKSSDHRDFFDQAHCTIEFANDDECLFTGEKYTTRSKKWLIIVDGASTTHIVNSKEDKGAMTNYRKVREVVMMNKHPCKICARGDLLMNYDGVPILLKDVAYVPASKHRLLSVSRLLDSYKQGSVVYTEKRVQINLGEAKIVKGKRKGGLYYLNGKAKILSKLAAEHALLHGDDNEFLSESDELASDTESEPDFSVFQANKSKKDYSQSQNVNTTSQPGIKNTENLKVDQDESVCVLHDRHAPPFGSCRPKSLQGNHRTTSK
jgi:hypothetical protein